MGKLITNDYNIRLEYEIGCKNPSHLFYSMSNAIEAFKKADIMLSRTMNQVISTEQTLEGIELGSIFTKIRQVVEYEENETLSNFDAMEIPVNNYLEKGKKVLLDELNAKKDFSNIEDIDQIIKKIDEIAISTGVNEIFNYSQVPANEAIETMESLIEISNNLDLNESVKYSSTIIPEETSVEKNASISVQKIEESRTSQKIENEMEIILKIKKPDFIGESRWDFKHGKRTISAKILDKNWLDSFHTKSVSVSPGDSFMAKTHIVEYYDKFGNLVNDEYSILEIKDIITGVLE